MHAHHMDALDDTSYRRTSIFVMDALRLPRDDGAEGAGTSGLGAGLGAGALANGDRRNFIYSKITKARWMSDAYA